MRKKTNRKQDLSNAIVTRQKMDSYINFTRKRIPVMKKYDMFAIPFERYDKAGVYGLARILYSDLLKKAILFKYLFTNNPSFYIKTKGHPKSVDNFLQIYGHVYLFVMKICTNYHVPSYYSEPFRIDRMPDLLNKKADRIFLLNDSTDKHNYNRVNIAFNKDKLAFHPVDGVLKGRQKLVSFLDNAHRTMWDCLYQLLKENGDANLYRNHLR